MESNTLGCSLRCRNDGLLGKAGVSNHQTDNVLCHLSSVSPQAT